MREIVRFLGIAMTITALLFIAWIIHDRNTSEENQKIYDQGYKDACVDFYRGKLKMKLVEQEDGSTVWQKVEEPQATVDVDHRKKRGGGGCRR